MKTVATYTFLMDFKGGTYLSQVQALDYQEAVCVWARQLDISAIRYLSTKGKQNLLAQIPESLEFLSPITGIQNVWLFHYQFPKGLAHIHIFQTDTKS